MTKKELEVMENKDVDNTPLGVIKLAIASNTDIEKVEKALELQFKWEADQARKSYCMAMSLVHKNIKPVLKTLKNAQTNSKYAALDKIIQETKEYYTKEGFSITFYESPCDKENYMRLSADVIHNIGHKETYYYDNPIINTGIKGNVNMTMTHAKATATSYARRYLMCMIWNIPTGDDTDGNVEEEKLEENKVKILKTLMKEAKVDEAKFLEYLNIEKVEDMKKSDFLKAKVALEARKKEAK